MAVDLQVLITLGRPWFAYPMPNDFNMHTVGDVPAGPVAARSRWRARDAGPANWLSMDLAEPRKIRTGVHSSAFALGVTTGGEHSHVRRPAVAEPHRLTAGQVVDDAAGGFGYSWADASPCARRSEIQVVGRLRAVPCSYVSSRGESERFLYYDGPTLARPPFDVKLADGKLNYSEQDPFVGRPCEAASATSPRPGRWPSCSGAGRVRPSDPLATGPNRPPQGLLVRVRAGQAEAWRVSLPASSEELSLATAVPARGPDAEAALLELLTDAGLSDEAAGLVGCWREHFFRTGAAFPAAFGSRDV